MSNGHELPGYKRNAWVHGPRLNGVSNKRAFNSVLAKIAAFAAVVFRKHGYGSSETPCSENSALQKPVEINCVGKFVSAHL